MTENDSSQELNTQISKLLGLNKHLLTLSVFCYLIGFVITNLYLGSFGVVNLDILRIRYILTGLLFLFFLGTIVFPVYGLINVLKNQQHKTVTKTLNTVFFYTLSRYSTIFVVILAINIFASTRSNKRIIVFDPTITSSWASQIVNQLPELLAKSFRFTSILLILVIFSVSVLLVLMVVINPKDKDGNKRQRKTLIREVISEIKSKSSWGKFFKALLGTFASIFFILTIGFLINFMSDGNSNISLLLTPEWSRFLTFAFLIYLSLSTLIVTIYLLPTSSSKNEDPFTKNDPLDKYYSWLSLAAFGIFFTVPVYALNIYPIIPQQIGGGAVIEVNVLPSDELEQLLLDQNVRTYLLDRTSKGPIFLLVNEVQNNQTIVEVSESQIRSITYDLPQVTPTATLMPTPPSIIATPTPIQ